MDTNVPGIVVAVVFKGISDSNLGSIESFWVGIYVGYLNRKHFVGFQQIQSPPGTDVVAGVAAGATFPFADMIPIYGVIWNSK